MTTEEKARAYDEALKRADSLTEKYGGRDFAEYVFPELKESEDERIRKKIIENVRLSGGYTDEEIDEMISWLEKQKEQKPAEWSDYKDKVNIPYCSSEPEWSEEDEKILNELLDYCNTENATWYNWLKSLRPPFKDREMSKVDYPTTLDEIDQWLFDSFGILPGCCSSMESVKHTTARMVAEALWPKKEDKK